MPLALSSALADSGGSWQREYALRVIERERIDAPAVLETLLAGLRPVSQDWLADRLTLLWESSSPSGNMHALSWLHETGRLLSDLPHDIVTDAIDQAVRGSLRGFMPTVGEILAIAKPRLEERKRQAARMRVVVHGELGRPKYPWEPEERVIAPEDICTPEEAEVLIRRHRIGAAA